MFALLMEPYAAIQVSEILLSLINQMGRYVASISYFYVSAEPWRFRGTPVEKHWRRPFIWGLRQALAVKANTVPSEVNGNLLFVGYNFWNVQHWKRYQLGCSL